MNCTDRNLISKSHYMRYYLIEVVTKEGLTVYDFSMVFPFYNMLQVYPFSTTNSFWLDMLTFENNLIRKIHISLLSSLSWYLM
jgi:hypothetical protein